MAFVHKMSASTFPNEPLANPKSSITGPQYRFTVINDKIIRYEWAEDGQFEDRASTFAVCRNHPTPNFRLEDRGHELEIITSRLSLVYDKQHFSPNGFVVRFNARLPLAPHGAEWRYGHSSADTNLGGTARTLDDVDGRCDMGLGIISRRGFAIMDDSESMLFDDNGFVSPRRQGTRIDGYIFAYGADYKGAMQAYYAISGQQPKIPRWALGNWWSRYHPYRQDEYIALMDKFKHNQLPFSVAVIDMDWHWVHEDFVPHTGWTGYSWNTNLFPDPKAFTRDLADRQLKVTLNDHPHSGVHSHENVYQELAIRLGHDTTNNDPIYFEPTSAVHIKAFFDLVHRQLETIGCDFWWIDWQQGTDSRVKGFDPLWLLNHFQFLDTMQQKPHSLPIIFSRYAGPGSHRYPIGFSGDTLATWASLRFQPEFTATASNIGFGWWSHDIGGHLPGDRDDECATRWLQYAVFSPILRLHSTLNRWMSKEPWLYRDEYASAMKESLRLRHRLVPYIYSWNASADSILPIVQPMYWEHPLDDLAYRHPNQYYFTSLVVSPIVDPKDTKTNLATVSVWIPPQRHVDIFTGFVYDGERELDMYRDISGFPVLAPQGSIIPLDASAAPSNGCKNPHGYEVIVVVGRDGYFDIIEDSQDDADARETVDMERRIIKATFSQAVGQLALTGGHDHAWTIRFISTRIDPANVRVTTGSEAIHGTTCINDGRDTLVTLPTGLSREGNICVEIGPDPQLAVLDHSETISRLLLDFQIDFKTKDSIWDIVQADQPKTVKIGRLLAMSLDTKISGPILELLLADSRS